MSNSPYPLTPRTQQVMDEWQDANYTGQPADYGLYGRQLRIFPVPNDAYRLDISGLGRLAPNPLTQETDTNAWMTDGAAIIRAQAKLLVYRDLLRDETGVALAQNQLVEAGGTLTPASAKRKMAAQAFTGRIRPWSL